jgi:hypothetical protein
MRLTLLTGPDYVRRPPVHAPSLRLVPLAAALLLAACGGEPRSAPAPLDRFTYPTGIALREGKLLVVSSDFDLTFARDDGGSLLQVDLAGTPPAIQPGGLRLPAFGGEVAVAEPAECGVPEPLALVPSRGSNTVYRVSLAGGGLACGPDCPLSIESGSLSEPYGVGLSCPAGGPARAWVGYMSAPETLAWLAMIDLQTGAWQPVKIGGVGLPRSFAYDADRDRLFFTSVDTGLAAPLRWLELGGGCTPGVAEVDGGCPIRQVDLSGFLRGAEPRGIALSNPQPGFSRRIYLSVRVYDATVAAAIGSRPSYDIAGMLFVLDLEEGPYGDLRARLVRMIDVAVGAAEIRVLPARAGKRDLVAMTATDDGVLAIYDDEAGALARVFTRDPVTGAPEVGRSPFGLAVQDLGAGVARLFVGSFARAYVTPVDVPLDAPDAAHLVPSPADPTQPLRIGEVTP